MALSREHRVIVVGAGASGLMAAAAAAAAGAHVLVLEKMTRPGEKLLITGKSRCNLTNDRDLSSFLAMYGPNGPFLHGAFHRFFRDDLKALLARYGVETKTERGGRVFPASDRAADVVEALVRHMNDQGALLQTGQRVTGIRVVDGRVEGVDTESGPVPSAAVVLATGGASWPGTGSSGDGYRMARSIDLDVTKLRPALVPLVVEETSLARSLQGIALRHVRMTSFSCLKGDIDPRWTPRSDTGRGLAGRRPRPPVIESRFGEMLFTHFGIGGPTTLLMSLAVVDALEKGPVSMAIDLKPALTPEILQRRIQGDLDQYGKRQWHRILGGLLPSGMVEPFCLLTGIDPAKPAHQISATERNHSISLMKSLEFQIVSPLPLTVAIVTAGGISLREVDSRTMAVRRISGLFGCGEVLDIDADTGGYNLQAAFSTGFVAGRSAAAYARDNG